MNLKSFFIYEKKKEQKLNKKRENILKEFRSLEFKSQRTMDLLRISPDTQVQTRLSRCPQQSHPFSGG